MNIAAWISKLDRAANWNKRFGEVNAMLERGEVESLKRIAGECARATPEQSLRWSMLERIVSILALEPSRRNVVALMEIFEEMPSRPHPRLPRLSGPNRARYMASVMAQAQAPEDLLDLGAWAGNDSARQELAVCCVHELVARGREIERDVDGLTRQVLAEHPLGDLPLRLLPCEAGFPSLLPTYSRGGLGVGFASARTVETADEGEPLRVTPLFFDAERAQCAVANWKAESNGRIESGAFSIEPPVGAGEFGWRILRDSGLEAACEVESARRIPFDSALDILFGAASNGGAYGSGEYGAWGRLLAWRSAGALIGADADANIEVLAAAAGRCAWLEFAGQGSWFYNVAWDVGLACLRADGASVAILCASDTD